VNANTFIATIGKGLARAERQAGCDWAKRRFGQHFEIERITGTDAQDVEMAARICCLPDDAQRELIIHMTTGNGLLDER
jgi:hypothetical protein